MANDIELYYSLRSANVARQREIDPAGHITPLFRGVELAGRQPREFTPKQFALGNAR